MPIFKVFTLWLLLAASALAQGPARVVRVIDGDTLVVQVSGVEETVRLYGVDAPERNQPGGEGATVLLTRLAGSRVTLVDRGQRRSYGRLVVDVEDASGKSINLALVRAGWAWWADSYRDDPAYARAELDARRELAGMWGLYRENVAPWVWRAR